MVRRKFSQLVMYGTPLVTSRLGRVTRLPILMPAKSVLRPATFGDSPGAAAALSYPILPTIQLFLPG